MDRYNRLVMRALLVWARDNGWAHWVYPIGSTKVEHVWKKLRTGQQIMLHDGMMEFFTDKGLWRFPVVSGEQVASVLFLAGVLPQNVFASNLLDVENHRFVHSD